MQEMNSDFFLDLLLCKVIYFIHIETETKIRQFDYLNDYGMFLVVEYFSKTRMKSTLFSFS